MTELELLKQAPPFAVLAALIIFGLKYLKSRDQRDAALHDRTADVIERNTGAMHEMRSAVQDNTEATKELCKSIKNGNGGH